MWSTMGAAVLISMCIVSCQQQEVAADFYEKMPEGKPRALSVGAGYGAGSSGYHAALISGRTRNPQTPYETMRIKKAFVRFEVKDYKKTHKRVLRIIGACDSYISSEKETNSDYQLSNDMRIRVWYSLDIGNTFSSGHR